MKSLIKEIISCIYLFIKEITCKTFYVIKQIIIFLIILFVSLLLAFGISKSFGFSTYITIIIYIILLILSTYIYAILYGNFKKPFCNVQVVAKVIDTMTLSHVDDDSPYYEHEHYILVLEYKYKNKSYKKKFEVSDGNLRKIGTKVNIMICDKFPKIIYIVKDKNEDNSI